MLVGEYADWGVLDRVHIGAAWRIRLSRPCAAAMRPYFDHLLNGHLIPCSYVVCLWDFGGTQGNVNRHRQSL